MTFHKLEGITDSLVAACREILETPEIKNSTALNTLSTRIANLEQQLEKLKKEQNRREKEQKKLEKKFKIRR
tara:strand:+ start:256 stop:471 length:216 start_codon:yes stop_codon:yes gene_type:complete